MSSSVSRPISGVLAIVLLSAAASHATVRYVAVTGSGTDGLSWATAYKTIDAAVDATSLADGDEIWVKQGTYGTGATLYVEKAVKIYGGYTGSGNTRVLDASLTVVTGINMATHCFDVSANAVISYFTITKGRASGSSPSDDGGGMYIHDCAAQVANCVFNANTATRAGGAISLRNADGATISDCTFTANHGEEGGGAIYMYASEATIDSCQFEDNEAGDTDYDGYGGAIYVDTGAPTVTTCSFSENSAQYGAGLCNYTANTYVTACSFADCNTTTIGGGGIYNWGGTPTITTCLFQDNHVTHKGGAVFDKSLGTFANCILWNNRSMSYGGAFYIGASEGEAESGANIVNCVSYGNSAYQGGGVYSDNASSTLTNCVFWGDVGFDEENDPEIYNSTWVYNRKTVASYCDIAGSSTYTGTGNLNVAPKFVNATGGDFTLQADSPCVDAGTNSARNLPSTDYAGRPRVRDGDEDGLSVVDMGVLEVQGFGLSDHVYSGQIYQGLVYTNAADTTPQYMFMMEFQTDGVVESIQFRSPAGNTFNIPSTTSTTSGEAETHHIVSGDTHIWQYWAGYDTAAGLNIYGDGAYVVTYRTTSGNRDTMMGFELENNVPIPQPTQKPVITSPTDGASVASPVTLTWNACTDTNANAVYVNILDADTDLSVAGDNYDKSATSSNAYTLGEGGHDAEVSFASLHTTTDSAGIPYEMGKGVMVGHTFNVTYTAVYRFWSPVNSVHFYTISPAEKDNLIANYSSVWTFEGTAYHTAATASQTGLLPVYRFWSGRAHFYTINEEEKDWLVSEWSSVWTLEGVAFYAYPEGQQPSDAKPIYRFWSPVNSVHFYTVSDEERDNLNANYSYFWTYEGVAFYAYP